LSLSGDQVTVQSVTGVDLTLGIAGPGTRSYAFVIDWHIRAIVAAAWLLIAYYVFDVALTLKSAAGFVSVLPASIIYFLYHPALEVALGGRTPGKRMAGVRIVSRNGGPPGTSALLIRNIFRLIDSLPALYMLGLISCFVTANRVRVGDLAAGTLLVLDNAAAEESLLRIEALATRSQLPLDALELVDQVLERWDSLESTSRAPIARALLLRLGPGADAGVLEGLADADLRARLQAHLNSNASAAHV
jgi:uncharacterized RDD family membrane protein YckC